MLNAIQEKETDSRRKRVHVWYWFLNWFKNLFLAFIRHRLKAMEFSGSNLSLGQRTTSFVHWNEIRQSPNGFLLWSTFIHVLTDTIWQNVWNCPPLIVLLLIGNNIVFSSRNEHGCHFISHRSSIEFSISNKNHESPPQFLHLIKVKSKAWYSQLKCRLRCRYWAKCE